MVENVREKVFEELIFKLKFKRISRYYLGKKISILIKENNSMNKDVEVWNSIFKEGISDNLILFIYVLREGEMGNKVLKMEII